MGLIVNADDFGLSPEVNEAIALAFSKGMINRTTLMVNEPFAKQAMEIAKRDGFIEKVGLHFNLTSGCPLSKELAEDTVICDDKGAFTADFARSMKTRFFLPARTSQRIAKEAKSQLDAYKDLAGSLWHVDSHHHVHTDPSIWKVLRKVLKSYPITSVRLGRNMYKGGNALMRVYKCLLNKSINNFCSEKSQFFGSMEDYLEFTKDMDADGRKDFITKNQVEIMVHPMFDENGTLVDSMEEFPNVLEVI